MQSPRLDKWLWCARVFKTRALATAACRSNSVQVNDQPAKPSREVRLGEQVSVRTGLVTRTLEVAGIPKSRVAAKELPAVFTDLTPPEEYEKLRRPKIEHFLAREPGAGRPTKRDRRALKREFGFD